MCRRGSRRAAVMGLESDNKGTSRFTLLDIFLQTQIFGAGGIFLTRLLTAPLGPFSYEPHFVAFFCSLAAVPVGLLGIFTLVIFLSRISGWSRFLIFIFSAANITSVGATGKWAFTYPFALAAAASDVITSNRIDAQYKTVKASATQGDGPSGCMFFVLRHPVGFTRNGFGAWMQAHCERGRCEGSVDYVDSDSLEGPVMLLPNYSLMLGCR
jgi:hypothetical protein